MSISPIELRTNINTDAVKEDTVYMNSAGECIQNTGIVLPGEAVTNQYLEETTYSDANLEEVYINSKGQVYKSFNYTDNAQVSYMTIDGKHAGFFWRAGVECNIKLTGYSDYILIATGNILAIRSDGLISELTFSNSTLSIVSSKYLSSATLDANYKFVYRDDITYANITANDIYTVDTQGRVISPQFGAGTLFVLGDSIKAYRIKGSNKIVCYFNYKGKSASSINSFYWYAYTATTNTLSASGVVDNAVGWSEYNLGGFTRLVWFYLSGWSLGATVTIGQTIGCTTMTASYTETPANITTSNATFGTFTGVTLGTWGQKYLELNCKSANFRGKIVIYKRTDGYLTIPVFGENSASGTPPSTGISYNYDLYYSEAIDVCVATKNGSAIGITIGDVTASSFINRIGDYDQTNNLFCVTTSTNVNRYILYSTTDGFFQYIIIKTPSKRFLSDTQLNTVHYRNVIDYDSVKLTIGNIGWCGAGYIRCLTGSMITGTDYIAYTAQINEDNKPIANIDFGYKTLTGTNVLTLGSEFVFTAGMTPAFDGIGIQYNIYATTNTNNILYFQRNNAYVSPSSALFNNTTNYSKFGVNTAVTVPDIINLLGRTYNATLLTLDVTQKIYIQTTDLTNPVNSDNSYDKTTYFYNLPYKSTYQIGNFIQQELDVFILYGNYYGYDGDNIYILTFQNQTGQNIGTFVSSQKIVSARGLKYIDASPTEAYFYSTFDNSIYSFNGGRSCEKVKGLSGLDNIIGGIYNVRDNTLLIETTTQLIWLRNGIWSLNDKTASQTNLQYYSTANGIYLKSGLTTWRYGYENIGSVLDLIYQTKFYGLPNNQTCKITEWVLRVYDPDMLSHIINLTNYVNDETGQKTQEISIQIVPEDYSTTGYTYIRLQPGNSRCVSASLKVECLDKIYLIDMTVTYNEEGPAIIPANRSA